MEPTIGRSIRDGLLAAHRSWAVMAAMTGCWILVFVVVGALATTTHIPQELLREEEQEPGAPVPAPATSAHQTSFPATTPTVSPASASATTDVAAPSGTRSETERDRERTRIALEWIGRAWPILGLCLLILLIAGVWIQGAQLGYLAKQVTGAHPALSECMRAGTRAFRPLLGATLLSLAVTAGVILLLGLEGALLTLLSRAVPHGVIALLVVLEAVGLVTGLVWVGVRVLFWFIIVVASALGPIQALHASFRATRGRWWAVCGFTMALAAIAIGVQIAGSLFAALLNGIGGIIGGPLFVVFSLIGNGVWIVANLFVSFAVLAAYIRYYTDLAGSSVIPTPVTE